MSNASAIKTSSSAGLSSTSEKEKKWQNELLMERLKTKSASHRNFQEMAKAMRMALLEKRYALDHVEKANLQKCLDSMQHCIKVTTRQGLVERLESLTRQLGLKFMEDQSGLFISSDMFYLEIVLDSNGTVQDVKVHHEGNNEQQSCSELVDCLVKGDFTDFTQQLEGLASIYQLNTEQKLKSKAYIALQALETDLTNMFMFQNVYKDPLVLLCKSAVGILKIRRGGHPMKLTFFVSPYDLLDLETRTIAAMSIDLINSKNIGMSVTVNLEASAANKLQITPLLMVNKDQQGRSTPVYTPFTQMNSTLIPASFVLRLNKPLPIAYNFVQKMKQFTDLNFGEETTSPILGLIAQHESNGSINSPAKGLFVSLPDQNHCYFITNSNNLDGIVINSVPFTEPGHVPQILGLLRLQAAFNSLISSCIRIKGKQDLENAHMFEVSAISCQNIIISLEHPFEESMATVEVNLTDLTNIVCKIYTLGKNYDYISIKLSKIIQKCMSIPVTMRSLINYWEQENLKATIQHRNNLENGNFNLGGGSVGGGGGHGPIDPGGRDRDVKTNKNMNSNGSGISGSSGGGSGTVVGTTNRTMFNQSTGSTSQNNSNTVATDFSDAMFMSSDPNSLLGSQLSCGSPSIGGGGGSGNGSGGQDVSPSFNNELSASSKSSKKRRQTNNMSSEDFWKSPKSNKFDVECNSNNSSAELLLECSNMSSDSNSLGTSASVLSESGVATPNSQPPISFPPVTPTNTITLSTSLTDGLDLTSLGGHHSSSQSSISNQMSDDGELTDPDSILKSDLTKISPSVSITPIPSNMSSMLTSMNLEKRPGIEIIPFATTTPTQQNLPSSITITPINTKSSSSSSGETKKSSSSSGSSSSSSSKQRRTSDDARRQEKKKKRKRDDSPMGPPEKLPPSKIADPLVSKSITIGSVKSSDCAPISPTGLVKKFSSSSSSSPVHKSGSNSAISTKSSPKNSPIYHGSPKHSTSSSPKHHTSSGSGKPSMSQLKSATNSPSSKSSSSSSGEKSKSSSSSSGSGSSSSRDGRDSKNDKKISSSSSTSGGSGSGSGGGTSSPKLKQPTVKLTKTDLSVLVDLVSSSGCGIGGGSNSGDASNTSSSSPDSTKSSSSSNSQNKNRKSSLSAVIDKLKSAQNVGDELLGVGVGGSGSGSTAGQSSSSSGQNKEKISGGSSGGSGSNKDGKGSSSGSSSSVNKGPSEYMVKPSSDGMKITINKTKSKESSSNSGSMKDGNNRSSSSSSSSGSNSPSSKSLSGLKPGVNSGPASKKSVFVSSGSTSPIKTTSSLQKSNSSGNLSASLSSTSSKSISSKSGLPKTSSSGSLSSSGSSESKRDKVKSSSSTSSSSKMVSNDRHQYRNDTNDVMKMLGFQSTAQAMEGFIKSKQFQIPKLSARSGTGISTTSGGGSGGSSSSISNDTNESKKSINDNTSSTSDARKMLADLIPKDLPQKYPFTINKVPDTNTSSSSTSTSTVTVPPPNSVPHHQYGGALTTDLTKDLSKSTTLSPSLQITTVPINNSIDLTSPVIPTIESQPKLLNNSLITKEMDSSTTTKLMRPPSVPPILSSLTPANISMTMTKMNSSVDDKSMVNLLNEVLDFSSTSTTTPSSSSSTSTMSASSTTTKILPPIRKTTPPLTGASQTKSTFPASPSVSVHIVKSPVPSPLTVIPSPHSNTSCITDDDLMDEALVGISGK